MQLAILGQSQDVQCNLGIRGYSDNRYIGSWPSSDSPRMYNMTLYNFASVTTLSFYDFPWCHWTVMKTKSVQCSPAELHVPCIPLHIVDDIQCSLSDVHV